MKADLGAIRTALKLATPGPWGVAWPGQCCHGYCIEALGLHSLESVSRFDLAIIANAPEWIEALCDEVDRLSDQVEVLRHEVGCSECHSTLGHKMDCGQNPRRAMREGV